MFIFPGLQSGSFWGFCTDPSSFTYEVMSLTSEPLHTQSATKFKKKKQKNLETSTREQKIWELI